MAEKQIFAWTNPVTPAEGYVEFLQIFQDVDDGKDDFRVTMRTRDGETHSIMADRSVIRAMLAIEPLFTRGRLNP